MLGEIDPSTPRPGGMVHTWIWPEVPVPDQHRWPEPLSRNCREEKRWRRFLSTECWSFHLVSWWWWKNLKKIINSRFSLFLLIHDFHIYVDSSFCKERKIFIPLYSFVTFVSYILVYSRSLSIWASVFLPNKFLQERKRKELPPVVDGTL